MNYKSDFSMKKFMLLILFFMISVSSYGFESYTKESCTTNIDIENKFLFCEKICDFKFNNDKGYGYCGKKIKKIAFAVELGSDYQLTRHLPYVKNTIYESLKSIDARVDEYKYEIIELSSMDMAVPKGVDYFIYAYIENPNFNSKTMRVSLFKSIGGKFSYVFDELPVEPEGFDSFFLKNVGLIVNEIRFEIFYKK